MGNSFAPPKVAENEVQGTCIPVQVGPPSPYALRIRHWAHLILILQLTACILRGVVLLDLLGCFWMVLVCGLGWFAWYHNMNIGYVTMWGMACSLNAVFDVCGFLVPAVFGLFKLELEATIIRIFAPCAEILGALFAWHLYHDYKTSKGERPARDCDPLGATFQGADPEHYAALKALNQQGGGFWVSQDYGSSNAAQPGNSYNPFQTMPASEQQRAQGRQQTLACC
eukprot:TRINITY_DN90595_c0_g1_i1.p1 TRINITY_DN90595_c0_g1~~TRINITY_DN90595_c0_g1_i1.p1  ORF type:complete len:226 (+),score=31.24 TRINITY_DN90595_c0_g1_i1:38-715(+)